ncbi:MAG: hypothetical protein ABI439_06720 [Rhodospirillales bacterium]
MTGSMPCSAPFRRLGHGREGEVDSGRLKHWILSKAGSLIHMYVLKRARARKAGVMEAATAPINFPEWKGAKAIKAKSSK